MRRVLIIEDNASFCRHLCKILAAEGFDVTVAENGRAGLAKFHLGNFELVITDVIMPEMEGIETISALRRFCPQLKIIAISGGGRRTPGDYLLIAREIGADATLAKPFSGDELKCTIDLLLGSGSSSPRAAQNSGQ